ncbi:MAG: LacI family DNA-binding transcriptional regulator [Thermoanaerobacteraceae bacterium]|nr:LacI family DNA-binding transcriptional regulator [Thermoanaerobacteraceae bacterium]
MATIDDVAKKAGVGRSTVSRVLNNSPKVSDKTRELVFKAIKELDYHPSSIARGLAGNSTYTIGIILDNTMDKAYANPFIYEVLRGIEKTIYENGYNLLLVGMNTRRGNKLATELILQGKMVDGLVLQSQLIMSPFFKIIQGYNLPVVSIGKLDKKKEISWVDIDNFEAGYMAASYLYSRGYNKIAFEGIDDSKVFAVDRYRGYLKFIHEIGSQPLIADKFYSDVDAIICLDNMCAFKVLQNCKQLGKKIPEEIGIMTFDDYPLAEYLEPTITNIDVDLFALGSEVGKEILRKVKERDGDVKEIQIPVSINVRESTK